MNDIDTPTNQFADPTPLAEPQRAESPESQLIALAERLRALFPDGYCVELDVRDYHSQRIQISVHGIKSYAEATAIFRRLGIQRREKRVVADAEPRSVLIGLLGTVEINAYCAGLPPSCRLEKFVERIPKHETFDTGAFIEVERVKVICGNGEKV